MGNKQLPVHCGFPSSQLSPANMRKVELITGRRWRYILNDLPSRSTLNGYFCAWNRKGALDRLHNALYTKCSEAVGT
jgi:hypothetical protein